MVILPPLALADVVQQGSRADNRAIGPFRSGDPLGQRGDAQHVVEVVSAAAVFIKRAREVDRDGILVSQEGSLLAQHGCDQVGCVGPWRFHISQNTPPGRLATMATACISSDTASAWAAGTPASP